MSKTETQSEALQLADACADDWHAVRSHLVVAELRRLDAEVRELKMAVHHESLCVEAAKERIEALDAENKALRAMGTPADLIWDAFVEAIRIDSRSMRVVNIIGSVEKLRPMFLEAAQDAAKTGDAA